MRTVPRDHFQVPTIDRYLVTNEEGEVLVPRRSNGQEFALSYKSLAHARRGAERWGGLVWDTREERWV